MAKEQNYTLAPIPLGEFSSAFIESGTYRVEKLVYAVHPMGKDRYALFVDGHLSGDTLDGVYVNKWFASFLTDKTGERLLLAPTEDGVHLAGPEGTTVADYLAIATGDWEFTDEEPEELYQGHMVGAVAGEGENPGSVKLWRADWTQAWEAFKKCMPDGVLVGESLSPVEGYEFDFRLEPRAYGKKSDDGKTYDVLVPVSLVSAPEKKKAGSTTVSKAKTNTKTKNNTTIPTPEPEDEGEEESNEEAQSQNEESEAVEAAIIEAITGKGPLTADKWLGKAVSLAPSKLKAKVAAYRNNKKWLFSSDRPWTSDAVKGTIEI